MAVSLGEEIRRRRKTKNWTLERLAHQSGLSAHYLSELENDRRNPSLSVIETVSRSLGADAVELLGGSKVSIPPIGVEAARSFLALSEEAQETVLRLIRLLGSKRRR